MRIVFSPILLLIFASIAAAGPVEVPTTEMETPSEAVERVDRQLSAVFPLGMTLKDVQARLKREGLTERDAPSYGDNRPLLLVPIPRRAARYALPGQGHFIHLTFDSRDRLRSVSIFPKNGEWKAR